VPLTPVVDDDWSRGDPITRPAQLVTLVELAGGKHGLGMGPVHRNEAAIKELLAAGPITPEHYETVLADIKAEGGTPNVGYVVTRVATLRRQGARGLKKKKNRFASSADMDRVAEDFAKEGKGTKRHDGDRP
jgi:hypothetical protein